MGGSAPAYPVSLRLEGQRVLVVGGGPVGERKVTGLVTAGARVILVSPGVTEVLASLAQEGAIQWEPRVFQVEDLEGCRLAVAATDSDEVNGLVASEARSRSIWVNDSTALERSDYTLPAVVRRGGLILTVGTEGGSPAYSKLVRGMLEEGFGEEHAKMLGLLSELRPRVMATFPESSDRRAFWDRIVTLESLEQIRQGEIEVVKERAAKWLLS